MLTIDKYQQVFTDYLNNSLSRKEPVTLYKPIHYMLQLGGKRLRPVLTLMSAEVFNCNYEKAMPAALSIEMFHNFSLVHDDIMDEAPLRRGEQTVHEKWNLNTGILSGDAMLIIAYQLFEDYEAHTFQSLAKLFSKTALEVCEGQQYDIDFEKRNDVTILEYLKMIEFKTAVLIAAAMTMGAIIADASIACQQSIYEFGKNLGIAFQIQDDYLDAFGDPINFGKQVGGDIIENKKTYLYLKAMQFSGDEDRKILAQLYASQPEDASQKVETIKQLFNSSGASEATKTAIENYTNKALKVLDNLSVSEDKKKLLKDFGLQLMNRNV